MRGTVWFSEFPNGGFANTVFQYIFSVYLKESLDVEVLYGRPGHNEDALCWEMFDIPKLDPERYERELKRYAEPVTKFFGATFKKKRRVLKLSENRRLPPSNDVKIVRTKLNADHSVPLLVDGYFQYDTALLRHDKTYIKIFKSELVSSKLPNSFLKTLSHAKAILCSGLSGARLFTLHIRRGDYLTHDNSVCYQLDLNQCLKKIISWKQSDPKSAIYVATDDLPYAKEFFGARNLAFLSSGDFVQLQELHDNMSAGRLFLDLAAIVLATEAIISNSSFSLLGLLVNQNQCASFRHKRDGNLYQFDAWNSPVLIGL